MISVHLISQGYTRTPDLSLWWSDINSLGANNSSVGSVNAVKLARNIASRGDLADGEAFVYLMLEYILLCDVGENVQIQN